MLLVFQNDKHDILFLCEMSGKYLQFHALFETLLFICSGIAIHSIKEYQNIRFMDNFSNTLNFTF